VSRDEVGCGGRTAPPANRSSASPPLKVIAQAISSRVAAIAPCICGNSVEAISSVVE